MRRALEAFGLGEVSLWLPGAAIVMAVGLSLLGYGTIGVGMVVGALLAFFNSALLLKRIDIASGAPNPAAALLSMQAGLIMTFTAVGLLTLLMIHISVLLTVAMAISFFVSQTAELILVYRARSRAGKVDAPLSDPLLTGKGA